MMKKKMTFRFVFFFLIGLTPAVLFFTQNSLHALNESAPADTSGSSKAVHLKEGDPVGSSSNVFVHLSKKLMPSVVNISSITLVRNPLGQMGPDDVMRRFFGDLFRQYNRGGRGEDDEETGPPLVPPQRGQKLPRSMSLGTGFILDSSGLILTNNHVVAEADEIKISFTEAPDEKPSDAEVVGRDPEIDVALIKVKNKQDFAPVILGDSDALEVGEYVMAVGNPFGQGHSVTHGIISAKGRIAPDFPLASYIQTDAPINPGNSGGPLVNLKGEVIGINNAIDQRAQGIGFAIPINLVKKVIPQLKSKGSVTRGFIGVLVENLTPEVASSMGVPQDTKHPVVTHVYPGEPADQAGIQIYDVILSLNGKSIATATDLMSVVTGLSVGETAQVKLLRSGKEKAVSLKVGKRPEANAVAQKGTPKKGKKQPHVDTGMTLEDITVEVARDLGLPESTKGVVVSQVAYGSPADKSGLIRGDVLLEVDRKPITDAESFYTVVREKKSYLIRVRRRDPQGTEGFLVVILNLRG
ncbi:MAG: trypsin-like peptidase domain-containing protein [Bdellovibrionia bacterium]